MPRYPKDLAVIIVKAKGRENTFRDVTMRKQKVHNALVWLINNNPHYSELSPSRRREAPCEGTNPPRLFTPGETKALAESKVHQISRAWVSVRV